MDINATLLGQAIVFGILIWFSWKFIWPPLVQAVEDRQKKLQEFVNKNNEDFAKKLKEEQEKAKAAN